MFKRMNIAVALLSLLLLATGCGSSAPIDNNKTDSSTESRKEVEAELTETSKENGKDNGNSGTEDAQMDSKQTEYEGSVTEDGEYIIELVDTTEENIIVPDEIDGAKVVEIGANAFTGEKTIKSIELPDTVKWIDSYAFSECTALEKIDLGSGVEYMGDMVFSYCTSLTSLRIPEGTTTIGALFCFCPSLKEVYIPASVTEISGMVLDNTCPNGIIVTPSGSTAEKHAIEYEFKIKTVEDKDYGIVERIE